ncbi:MAG: hypothetical protein UHM08_08970 [Bacteroidales bacterium]|nr:hypothetical protein [Bacteroidales bacterium]
MVKRMTENKRFRRFYNYLIENETNKKYDIQDCCNLLNNLSNENEQLRLQLNNCSDQRTEFHRGARENANRVGKLKKENEQLKKILNELSDMLQFDVKNGIRSYPVKLSEYLSNALKELQKND